MDAAGRSLEAAKGSADAAMRGVELLVVRGVSKSFGGTQALDDVGMRLESGEIVALLGRERRGQIDADQNSRRRLRFGQGRHQLSRRATRQATLRRLPIAFIHQDLGLIDWMTVAENICLTLGYPRRGGLIDTEAARARAPGRAGKARRRHRSGRADPEPHRTEKSLVAIARALAADAEVLVLDEPTASLPADEVVRLFTALRRLRDSRRRHDLRLASAGRGVRDRRPDGRAARRPGRGRARGRERRRRTKRSC